MLDQIWTPQGFLNPVAAAIMATLLNLWIEDHLKDWRWKQITLLALSIGLQFLAGAATGAAWQPEAAFQAAWHGFLGASVAVYGQETILNILGLANRGPRTANALREKLGTYWTSWR